MVDKSVTTTVKTAPAATEFKVKNTGKRALSLSLGCIKPGETGVCTPTEYSTFYQYLTKV